MRTSKREFDSAPHNSRLATDSYQVTVINKILKEAKDNYNVIAMIKRTSKLRFILFVI